VQAPTLGNLGVSGVACAILIVSIKAAVLALMQIRYSLEWAMRKSIVAFFIILMGVAVFAASYVSRHGWDEATYFGRDIWGLFFFGAGGVSIPLVISVLVAGVRKLSYRVTSFYVTWVWTFIVCVVVFSAPTFYVALHLSE
jgi:hypothetical protein